MKIISISGIDGCGKTTIARALARRMNGRYRKQKRGPRFEELLMSGGYPQPTPTDYGQALAMAYAKDFVAYAQRYGLRNTVAPVVVCDRWKLCVVAFAKTFGTDPAAVRAEIGGIPEPALSIVLNVPVGEALRRLRQRGALDWDENEAALLAIQEAYLSLAELDGSHTVAADRDVPAVIAAAEAHVVSELFPTS